VTGMLFACLLARRGRRVARLAAAKVARVVFDGKVPRVTLDEVEERLLLDDPTEPTLLATRAANARTGDELLATLALLALSRTGGREGDELAVRAMAVFGMMVAAVGTLEQRASTIDFVEGLMCDELSSEGAVELIRQFRFAASSGHESE
jgi:hypothetical protein